MSVSRKLFAAFAAFIVAISLIFAFATQVILKDTLHLMIKNTRTAEMEELSQLFANYYQKNGRSWNGVTQADPGKHFLSRHPQASIALLSNEKKLLYTAGEFHFSAIARFGIKSNVESGGKTIALLYYQDPETAYLSRLRIGILDTMAVLLFGGAAFFVLASLWIAYMLSRRLTAPLRQLIPAIDRLGKGEFGVQAPVVTKDEYGKVAQVFNHMSSQLARAEEIRRNLTADVAHELRTPLTIMRGNLDFLQQEGRPIRPEELLPLQDELIRLTRLVNDLHQLSLAEAKKLPLERKPTSISSILQRTIDRVSMDAVQKGIEITLDVRTEKDTLKVDPNRMTQIFLNLITNAIRYTPAGGKVRITVGEERDPNEARNMLQITVSDTGIGIEPDHLPFLFDRFYRTDEARTRNGGGMGLGLAIAKEFVLAHDGTIHADSRPGEGTTFIVRLPR